MHRTLRKLPAIRSSLKRFASVQTQSRTVGKESELEGCLFAPLRREAQASHSHHLDDVEGYLKFLKEDLHKEFVGLAPTVLGYDRRMNDMIHHTVPAFITCWTFGYELLARFLVPKEKQTAQFVREMRLLRSCCEMVMAGTTTYDDIIDAADTRIGKPTWCTICPEDSRGAVTNDSIILRVLPYHIIKKNFRNTPGYPMLLEAIQRSTTESLMGLSLELIGRHDDVTLQEFVEQILYMKAGPFFGYQPKLGLVHAGIMDEKLIGQVEQVFYRTGIMVQVWDDFCDYFCTNEQTGKPPCDFQNAHRTWASLTAMELFSDKQKQIFRENYGSLEPERLNIVRKLYDSVDLPNQYYNFMKSQAQHCHRLIAEINHDGCQAACVSWMHWLVGDVGEH